MSAAGSRVLVACVGNIFRSDDGFGSAVAARLRAWEAAEPPGGDPDGWRVLADGARLVDFGIRSVHLTYELLDGYDALVLVDTVARQQGPPGSVFVIEPDLGPADGTRAADGGDPDLPAVLMDPHDLPPASALELVPTLGGYVDRILVVGVQPGSLDDGIGLTAPVAAAVEPAARTVVDVVRREVAALTAVPTRSTGGGGS